MRVRLPLSVALLLACACASDPDPASQPDAGTNDASDGASGCTGTQTSCSGSCVDTKTSAEHCGGCGLACGTGESCCAGRGCSTESSCALVVSSISPAEGYIGGGTWVTVTGKGFTAGMSAFVGDGRAPLRVIDATTATILTPPGPGGSYDVKLTLGAKTTTLPKAYHYVSQTFTQQWLKIAMSTARGNFPTVTTLQDGRVLVSGGTVTSDPATSLDSADIYDPKTKAMTPVSSKMSVKRNTAASITLLDGRALVVGACNYASGTGCLSAGDRASADLFDPKTNAFSPTKAPLSDATRYYHRLTLLPDGKVLVVSAGNATAELFDPATDTFTNVPQTSKNGSFGFPARLRDGRVLFAGAAFETYDEENGNVSALTGGFAHGSAAVYVLPDGAVLSPGGADTVASNVTPTDEVAVYDPKKGQVSVLAKKLSSPRLKFASALLGDGSVMVAAGVAAAYPANYGCQGNTFPTTSAVDVVDAAKLLVTPFPPIQENNMELVATTLNDGSVLIGGGAPCGGAGASPYVYFLQGLPAPN
ncbi:hypothetical protein BH09MYX1_BH09MYX1_20530 [soil metagenome]